MKKSWLILSALIFLTASVLGNTYAADNKEVLGNHAPAQLAAAANEAAGQEVSPAQKKEAPSAETSTEKDKMMWCTKGKSLTNKVDDARKRVQEAEQLLQKYESGEASYSADAGAILKQAQKDLASAEQELSDLEQLAYTQGVPVGWVRCQFEY
jgi:hypothetical protein